MTEDKPTEQNVSVWEKRLTLLIITALIGYIATIAGDMKAQLVIIETRLTNTVQTIEKHGQKLLQHDADLRNQDNRLTRVEATIHPLIGKQ
jgi:hypothetical protein